MLTFQVLGSSSGGNSAIVETTGAHFLLDAGLSGLKTRRLLKGLGKSIDTIEAVFITHEHIDHTAGILGLSRFPHITFFANRDTADAVSRRLKRPINWQLFETGDTFIYKDLEVKTFSIPHDAYDPVGYVFKTQLGLQPTPLSFAWITDLGHIPPAIKQLVRSVDLLVIEANYDEELLEKDTKRPWVLKQRIRGRHGHLSNTDTHEFLATQDNAQWRHVHLVHLSRDCNCPQLVKKLFSVLEDRLKRFDVTVFDPLGGPGRIFNLLPHSETSS